MSNLDAEFASSAARAQRPKLAFLRFLDFVFFFAIILYYIFFCTFLFVEQYLKYKFHILDQCRMVRSTYCVPSTTYLILGLRSNNAIGYINSICVLYWRIVLLQLSILRV